MYIIFWVYIIIKWFKNTFHSADNHHGIRMERYLGVKVIDIEDPNLNPNL